MKLHWDSKSYGQRWQVETVFSMIKRNLTDSLASKGYWSQFREVCLLAIIHNLLIILFAVQRAFLQSKNCPFKPNSILISLAPSSSCTGRPGKERKLSLLIGFLLSTHFVRLVIEPYIGATTVHSCYEFDQYR